MTENDIAAVLAKKMTDISEFGIIACRAKGGFTVSIKGKVPELAFLIALVAKQVGNNKVPLEEFGDLINKALAELIEEART